MTTRWDKNDLRVGQKKRGGRREHDWGMQSGQRRRNETWVAGEFGGEMAVR
jgi:hypothetical protein